MPSADNTTAIVAIAVAGGTAIVTSVAALIGARIRQKKDLEGAEKRLRAELEAALERQEQQLEYDREVRDEAELARLTEWSDSNLSRFTGFLDRLQEIAMRTRRKPNPIDRLAFWVIVINAVDAFTAGISIYLKQRSVYRRKRERVERRRHAARPTPRRREERPRPGETAIRSRPQWRWIAVVAIFGIVVIGFEIYAIESGGAISESARTRASFYLAAIAAVLAAVDLLLARPIRLWALFAAYAGVAASALVGPISASALTSTGAQITAWAIFALGLVVMSGLLVRRLLVSRDAGDDLAKRRDDDHTP